MISNSLSYDTPPQSIPRSLFTLGNLTIDDIVLYDEQCMFLNSSGGDALFSAIGAWIWHKPVGIIARAGEHYPVPNIQQIEDAGITCHLKPVQNPDIRNWALYEPGGKRQFVNHLVSGSYEEMSITAGEIPGECLGAAAYHIAPMPLLVQQGILHALRRTSCLIALDQFIQHLGGPEQTRLAQELIARVDFYLPSREETAIIYGTDDPPAAARAFAALGAPVVCIKMGREGALLYAAQVAKAWHVPICCVQTIDPTGAGDAFCGGFLAGMLQTGDPLHAACYGAVSASYVVQHVGALNLLNVDFAERFERLEKVKAAVRSA